MKINRISVSSVDRTTAQDYVAALISSGLSLVSQHGGTIVGFGADGERSEFRPGTPIDALVTRCAGVQLWFDECTDVYLSWQSPTVLEVFVDGLTVEQAERVAFAISKAAASNAVRHERNVQIAFEHVS
jgi:hypothetical protein